MGKKSGKCDLRKKQLLCIFAGIFLSAVLLITGKDPIIRNDGSRDYLERPGYGEEDRNVELEAQAEDGNSEILSIPVKSRVYTREELTSAFGSMMPEVLTAMLGNNASQTEVRTDLYFPDSLENWPGIYLTWSVTGGEIIHTDGTVENQEMTGPETVDVKLTASSGGEEMEVNIPLTVLPAPERKTEKSWKVRLLSYLETKDMGEQTLGVLNLPEEFEGVKLKFREPDDYGFLVFPALGLLAAVLLELKPAEEEKKRKKERQTELLVDYSEVVSKLIVYIGAGLTVRNAWKQLADSYRSAGGPERAVYEEILVTDRELDNGETESRAYMNFARRCGQKCYIRMASLLEQNRKTGDSALLASLDLEMEEAFEQRKNVARRLGEEAGTKLMAPLILSLMTVLVIVVIPAFMSMG